MKMRFCLLIGVLIVGLPESAGAWQSELIDASVASELVPGPVAYSVLLPDGYSDSKKPFPLLIDLHGGGGDRSHLKKFQSVYDELWTQGSIPKMVVVTPSAGKRSFYMDFKDGSQKWETFIVEEFLKHVRARYNVRVDRKGTMITGVSMGGMGSLRLALKHTDVFGAVAALEPGIAPLLKFKGMRPKHRFWRADRLLTAAYGDPVDSDYWEANNPATLVDTQAEKIRDSGLQIYVEAGDEDQFWLYEGAEFLHRTLWDHRIKHEYHLVRGADHVGDSLVERKKESLEFLARAIDPPAVSRRSKTVGRFLDRMKSRLDESDHYSNPNRRSK